MRNLGLLSSSRALLARRPGPHAVPQLEHAPEGPCRWPAAGLGAVAGAVLIGDAITTSTVPILVAAAKKQPGGAAAGLCAVAGAGAVGNVVAGAVPLLGATAAAGVGGGDGSGVQALGVRWVMMCCGWR